MAQTRSRPLKVVLLLMAVGLSLGVFWLVQPRQSLITEQGDGIISEAVRGDLAATKVSDVAETVMTRPHFIGTDEQGRAWEVSAQKAFQKQVEAPTPAESHNTIVLQEVLAEAASSTGKAVYFKAGTGIFEQAANEMVLTDGVEIGAQNMALATNTLTYNMGTRTGFSTGQVTLTGPAFDLSADIFSFQNNVMSLIFEGHVKGILKKGR